jgi:hypothetical protein
MEALTMNGRALGKHLSLGLAGLITAILLYAGAVVGPIADAAAEPFCQAVTLAPYGQYGDRCYAWEWEAHPYLAIVSIQTDERAGCVTSADLSGNLKESWYCIGNGSSGWKYVNYTSEPRRGVIRNNNLNYSGRFWGAYTCCWNHT